MTNKKNSVDLENLEMSVRPFFNGGFTAKLQQGLKEFVGCHIVKRRRTNPKRQFQIPVSSVWEIACNSCPEYELKAVRNLIDRRIQIARLAKGTRNVA